MFYWKLIPRGWQQTIDEVDAHRAPAGAGPVRRQVRGRQRRHDRLHRRGRRAPRTSPSPPGPIADRTPVTHRHRPRHGDAPGRATAALDRPLGPRARQPPAGARSSCCWPPRGAAGVRLDPRGQVAGEADPGFPLLYAPPDGIGPAQAQVPLQREGRPHDVRRHADVRRREGRRRPRPAAGRRLDDHRQGRRRRAGPGSTRSPPTCAHILGGPGTSFTAQPRRTSTPGSGSRTEIARFDSSVETWAQVLRATWSSSGLGGFGGHAGAGRLRRRCWSARSGTPSP